jgi:hypothetical protein
VGLEATLNEREGGRRRHEPAAGHVYALGVAAFPSLRIALGQARGGLSLVRPVAGACPGAVRAAAPNHPRAWLDP